MPAEPFELRWKRKERACGMKSPAARFLQFLGVTLPIDAAPFLSFEDAERAPLLWELYGPADEWSAADRSRLGAYRAIGSDGAGNPICVESSSGVVWLLDHEDQFKTRQFVNSSAWQLAESLLARLGEKDVARLRAAISAIDQAAFANGAFWWYEANDMESTVE
jgi:hypothetical protein